MPRNEWEKRIKSAQTRNWFNLEKSGRSVTAERRTKTHFGRQYKFAEPSLAEYQRRRFGCRHIQSEL